MIKNVFAINFNGYHESFKSSIIWIIMNYDYKHNIIRNNLRQQNLFKKFVYNIQLIYFDAFGITHSEKFCLNLKF